MNKKRIAVVGIFLIVLIILIVCIFNLFIKKGENSNVDVYDNPKVEITKEEVFEKEKDVWDIKGLENTEVVDIYTAKNISPKIKELKMIGNLEVKDINVDYSSAETRITGTIYNKEEKDVDLEFVSMNVLGNDNKIIETNKIYVGKIKANSSKNLDFTTTANIVNLYDINFIK